MGKRIMRKFRIDELSGVDVPAQEGARVTIMKRDSAQDDTLEKRMPKPGEDEVDKEFLARFMGDETMVEEYPDEKQRYAVANSQLSKAVDFDTVLNEFIEKRDKTKAEGGPNEDEEEQDPEDQGPNESNNGEDMTEQELKNTVATLEKKLADAEAFGALNDAERAHYQGLDAGDRASFLKMGRTERGSQITKALEANPVVYTAETGESFRKNDDPRLVAYVKRNDELAKAARESKAREESATFEKRASAELGNLPGEPGTKVALLKALNTITDEALRGKATQILKAANSGMSAAFKRLGTTEGGGQDGDARPVDQLETLAKRYSTDNKVSIEKARVDVLSTAEGKALYAQTIGKGAGI